MEILVATPLSIFQFDPETGKTELLRTGDGEYFGMSWNSTNFITAHSLIDNFTLKTWGDYQKTDGGNLQYHSTSDNKYITNKHLVQPHQIECIENKVLVTNTGKNCISVYAADGTFEKDVYLNNLRWDIGENNIKGNHFNSIHRIGKYVYLIAHNHGRPSEIWKLSWPDLKVLETKSTAAKWAHNIWQGEHGTVLCNSMDGSLIDAEKGEVIWKAAESPIFTRGIIATEGYIIVGRSEIGSREERKNNNGGLWILARKSMKTIDKYIFKGSGVVNEIRLIDGKDDAHISTPFKKEWLQTIKNTANKCTNKFKYQPQSTNIPQIKERPNGPDTPYYDPASFVDDTGRVFHWQNLIFRGITPQYVKNTKRIFSQRNLDKLFEIGLVETSISTYYNEEYPLILQHKKVQFPSYCMEWPSVMLRDAALTLCNLNVALSEINLHLKDAHPWNILFDFSKPIFVDFGSIAPLESFNSSWAIIFGRYFIAPLLLFEAEQHTLARSLLTLRPDESLKNFQGMHIIAERWKQYKNLVDQISTLGAAWFIHQLVPFIMSIDIKLQITEWSGYEQKPAHNIDSFHTKQRVCYELLGKLNHKTLVDMGANRGWYSEMATSQGYDVTAFDMDDVTMSELYSKSKQTERPILPLLMSFDNPTPAHGRTFLGYLPAEQRLKCDVSLVLALVHHLSFKSGLYFDEIAKTISDFTKHHALVEFIPPEDTHVSKWLTPRHSWYTTDNFITEMTKYFPKYEIFESTPEPRINILFSK